jgi:hypothetical protein
MFAPITKVNELGESNTPCPSTLEVTYSSVEKLSKALRWYRQMELAYYPRFVLGPLVAARFNIGIGIKPAK